MASFSVVSNISAANAQANLGTTQTGLQKALTRLSSGYRINTAGDDAAGLAVANGFRNTVAVINQGIRNANDGLSKLQVYDGALNNISGLLDRLATLATQASTLSTVYDDGVAGNGVEVNPDQASLDVLADEYDKVKDEIDREAALAGLTAGVSFKAVMYDDSTNGHVSDAIGAVTTTTLSLALGLKPDKGVDGDWGGGDDKFAADALSQVTAAVKTLGGVQGTVGQLMNRLQFAIGLAQTQVVNTKAAESRIRDANVAEESANMTRFNILTQSGIAALAQANQSNSSVLSLLR